MIQRLYVHNFRCLENFELVLAEKPSALLIGRNGSGKSTIKLALTVLQRLARGTNHVRDLIALSDFSRGRTDVPMRFEVDVMLDGRLHQYSLAIEYVAKLRELRVNSEQLMVDREPVYTRDPKAILPRAWVEGSPEAPTPPQTRARNVAWNMVALPILQEQSENDPLFVFKRWLARSLLLAPIPGQISGESSGETLEPDAEMRNLGQWFTGLVAPSPAVYGTIDAYLKQMIPDLWSIKNPLIGGETRSLSVQFRADNATLSIAFADLSDGEKCVFICALVLAANESYGPVFCFWDEPDSHLSISEVGHFTAALRRAFASGGQILMTSHNIETIRRFSDENTLVLYRRNHFEPTRVQSIAELGPKGDLIEALIRGDVEP